MSFNMAQFVLDVSGILLHPQTTVHRIREYDPAAEREELVKYVGDKEMAVYVHFTAPLVANFQVEDFDIAPKSTFSAKDLRLIGAIANTRMFTIMYEIFSRTDTEVELEAVIVVPKTPHWGFFNPMGKWPEDMTAEERDPANDYYWGVLAKYYGVDPKTEEIFMPVTMTPKPTPSDVPGTFPTDIAIRTSSASIRKAAERAAAERGK